MERLDIVPRVQHVVEGAFRTAESWARRMPAGGPFVSDGFLYLLQSFALRHMRSNAIELRLPTDELLEFKYRSYEGS